MIARAKRLLRSAVYTIPYTQQLWARLNKAFDRNRRTRFSGWGMVTESSPPWQGASGDRVAREFAQVHADMLSRVADGRFKPEMSLTMQDPARQVVRTLEHLMWRHYIVFWSAGYAALATDCPVKTLVECGVCDGLTAYFAMRAVSAAHPFKAFLYDAWAVMKAEQLLDTERSVVGTYSSLSVDRTRRNLVDFAPATVFIKGYIPESFAGGIPSDIVWLHIDLNASRPTVAALEAMFEKVASGGVILFDDYGWPKYHDTKIAVDAFFRDKPGRLLPMPTGQAIFFRH